MYNKTERTKVLNKDIKSHFNNAKASSYVRGGIPINKAALLDQIARFFNSKIVELSNQLPVNDAVYNGTKKLEQDNKMFMDKNSIMECILALQTKNSEGFDRIPQRILVDGSDILIVAFEGLFLNQIEQ